MWLSVVTHLTTNNMPTLPPVLDEPFNQIVQASQGECSLYDPAAHKAVIQFLLIEHFFMLHKVKVVWSFYVVLCTWFSVFNKIDLNKR